MSDFKRKLDDHLCAKHPEPDDLDARTALYIKAVLVIQLAYLAAVVYIFVKSFQSITQE